jgi:cytochrome c peroxidase
MGRRQFVRISAIVFLSAVGISGVGVLAAAGGAGNFIGSLFPPGFSASTRGMKLGRQRINIMRNLPDNHPIRRFAAQKMSCPSTGQPIVQLGYQLFNDTKLSSPAGQSCASCHSPSAAFTLPNSQINASSGIAPGAVPGRFGNRLPPSITYAKFSPPGPFYDPSLTAYSGGLFWDGRAAGLSAQAQMPFFNPNEMNNIVHNVSDTSGLVDRVEKSDYSKLFKQVFGANAFDDSPQQNLTRIGEALAAFESTNFVSPFSSKYDTNRRAFTKSELNGLRLFTGSTTGRPGGPANYKSAQCFLCHGIPEDSSTGPDIFSNFCYSNIGVPANPNNPYYVETNAAQNPLGFNPQGRKFVDLGLGDFLYPASGLPSGNGGSASSTESDYLAINGTFKAPSLRNLDKIPYPGFVRAYMHNGYFKSLKDVVHFYNTRNLTSKKGEVIDFTKTNPYSGLQGKPLWPAPEFPSAATLQNPSGLPGSPAGQVGNLGLTPQEEDDLVAFLKTLTDK